MPSRTLRAGLVVCVLAVLAVPAAAAPPPQPVSAFDDGFGLEGYGPDYPPTNASNVTVDVAVAPNGTARWTERATLSNPETVAAFEENESLRRAAVAYWFDRPFGQDADGLRSRLDGEALVVTYRTNERVTRGPGGGVVFGTLAPYRNDYLPGSAEVTVRPPERYGVESHPAAFVAAGDRLRWNGTTAPGRAGVSGAVVTFAPADEALPSVRASLAHAAVYGPPTLRVAAAQTGLFGVPLGLLAGGASAFFLRRRRAIAVSVGAVALVGAGAFVGGYPIVNEGYAFFVLTNGLVFLGVPVALLAAVGLGCYAAAWHR